MGRPLPFIRQAKEPVGGDFIKFAEGNDVSDRNFVNADFVLAVLLLGGIQDFGDIHLAVSLFEANFSQVFSDVHLITPLLSVYPYLTSDFMY